MLNKKIGLGPGGAYAVANVNTLSVPNTGITAVDPLNNRYVRHIAICIPPGPDGIGIGIGFYKILPQVNAFNSLRKMGIHPRQIQTTVVGLNNIGWIVT